MKVQNEESMRSTRMLLMLLWGAICTVVVAAPLFAAYSYSRMAAFLYLFFAPVCHQMPERSFSILAHPLAVCHRCTGIYFGLFLCCLVPPLLYRVLTCPAFRRTWVLACSAPILTDGLLSWLGVCSGTWLGRFSTGFLFGAMLTTLLVPGVSQFISDLPHRTNRFPVVGSQGGNR